MKCFYCHNEAINLHFYPHGKCFAGCETHYPTLCSNDWILEGFTENEARGYAGLMGLQFIYKGDLMDEWYAMSTLRSKTIPVVCKKKQYCQPRDI